MRLTFSAGIETIDQNNRVADAAFSDFIDVAKRALRDAKEAGRDRVVSANSRNYQLAEKKANKASKSSKEDYSPA